ncbi:hypothetical protein DASB73_022220 [Starmerella bacillaris]|uniref:PQ loop repeat protein n=1 Tax=Starmerella bacillaris TaxID=1247836 RepID=A0AAV5RI51_STABA|nr:hypothetical protein DASB73_022220 [Starmerella bacillaris]
MSCEIYTGNPVYKTVLDSLFSVGIFLSYAPQIYLVLKRKNTEGLNPYFLLLMNIGSASGFFNIWILSRSRFECCRSLSAYDCYATLTGFIQLFSGFLGPTLLLLLAVRYREPGVNGEHILKSSKLVLLFDVVISILVLLIRDPNHCETFAMLMGLTALSTGLIQYFPQIITTYKLKHVGSLSVVSLLIQMPGGYIWCLSLAFSKDSRWTTWIPLFAASTSQAILLILALSFMYKNRSSKDKQYDDEDGDASHLINRDHNALSDSNFRTHETLEDSNFEIDSEPEFENHFNHSEEHTQTS